MVAVHESGEPLSNVDSAWLRMEDRTNLMTITAVMAFREGIEFERLKGLIEDRLLCYDRFRQRVVESSLPLARPRWVEDEHFNLRAHLQRIALPRPAGKDELQDMVSSLMSTPLDPTKPLWQFQLIDNYRGGCAVVARIHHCIADGIALVRVLLGMTDDSPVAARPRQRPRRPRSRPLAGGFWLPEVVNDALYSVRRITGSLLEESVETLLDPARAAELARGGVHAAGVLGKLLAMPADPETPLRGPLGTAKRCAWSDILPFQKVRAYGKAHGCTINDVLLAGVTGALRRYLQGRGVLVDDMDLRAVIPVNLRPDDAVDELGNRFGLVFLALPVGVADHHARMVELKRRMDALKTSSEAVVTFAVLNAIGRASAEVESKAVNLFGNKATAVMTNVPGPREEIYLAGKAVRSMMFWVPQAARLGLGVSILSYAGQVRLGVATDAGLIPDPGAIIAAFHHEMTAMIGGEDDQSGAG